jgi:hypothetical protein
LSAFHHKVPYASVAGMQLALIVSNPALQKAIITKNGQKLQFGNACLKTYWDEAAKHQEQTCIVISTSKLPVYHIQVVIRTQLIVVTYKQFKLLM